MHTVLSKIGHKKWNVSSGIITSRGMLDSEMNEKTGFKSRMFGLIKGFQGRVVQSPIKLTQG